MPVGPEPGVRSPHRGPPSATRMTRRTSPSFSFAGTIMRDRDAKKPIHNIMAGFHLSRSIDGQSTTMPCLMSIIGQIRWRKGSRRDIAFCTGRGGPQVGIAVPPPKVFHKNTSSPENTPVNPARTFSAKAPRYADAPRKVGDTERLSCGTRGGTRTPTA